METLIGTALISIVVFIIVYFHVIPKNTQAVLVLLLSGFLARLFIVSLDPFLNNSSTSVHHSQKMLNTLAQPLIKLKLKLT